MTDRVAETDVEDLAYIRREYDEMSDGQRVLSEQAVLPRARGSLQFPFR